MNNKGTRAPLLLLCLSITAGLAIAEDAATLLNLKPGFNFFSRQQDIELGKQTAVEVEKQVPLLTDPMVVRYINEMGRHLTQFEPLPADYLWTFKVINAREINAFALPGGIVYVDRGTIEAAENEAQLAGAIAHETGHVVMRHGTHQLSEIVLTQYPLAILGGLLGQSSSIMSDLAQIGIGFGVSSMMLHNSRSAESQADTVGTYILYHAGYNPYALARFFQIIEKKDPIQSAQFFLDHPIPANRIQAINAEIPLLGPPTQGRTDSPEFEAVKRRVMASPAARPGGTPQSPPTFGKILHDDVVPSSSFKNYDRGVISVSYPDNWEVFGDGHPAVTIAPRAGVSENAVAYGVMIDNFQPKIEAGPVSLDAATRQLLDSLRQGNPDLTTVGNVENIRVNHRPAKSVELGGPSPILDSDGQPLRERDWLVAVHRPDGSIEYMIMIAPEGDFHDFQSAFERMVQSFQLR
jgi:Zn-dependent protease with chaperone function